MTESALVAAMWFATIFIEMPIIEACSWSDIVAAGILAWAGSSQALVTCWYNGILLIIK